MNSNGSVASAKHIYLTFYSWSSDLHCKHFGGDYLYFSSEEHLRLLYSRHYSFVLKKLYQITFIIHPKINLIFIDLVFLCKIIGSIRLFSNCKAVYFQYHQTLFSIFFVNQILKKPTQVWFGSLPSQKTVFDKFVFRFTLKYCEEALIESQYLSNFIPHDTKKLIGTKVEVSSSYRSNEYRPIDYILVGFPARNKGIIDFVHLFKNDKRKSILIVADLNDSFGEEYCIIKHRLNSKSLHFLFSLSKSFVNVSPSEGGPRAMLEAYRCGCTIKSLKNSVAPDMIENGNFGVEVFNSLDDLIISL